MRERIYLDYAASTPVSSDVLRAMEPYFSERFGNPGSVHSFGQEAVAAVDKSRETIARALGAAFREIIFTGSATEANNLALRGAVRMCATGAAENSERAIPTIIASAIEHESVLETARDLERSGQAEFVELPVDRKGVVDTAALARALDERTAIVSVMHGNNETGLLEPVAEVARIIREFRERRGQKREKSAFPLFHTDASQTFQYLDCGIERLGADLVTLSAHKMYGPKGIGVLVCRQKPVPVITGGGQEFGVRSGTENVPAIVGLAMAVTTAARARAARARRVESLRRAFEVAVVKLIPSARFTVPTDAPRLPHIVNFRIPGVAAENLTTALDLVGVAVSAGSACSMRSLAPSHVLIAMGCSEREARESIRVSFGEGTTRGETKEAARRLKEIALRFTK